MKSRVKQDMKLVEQLDVFAVDIALHMSKHGREAIHAAHASGMPFSYVAEMYHVDIDDLLAELKRRYNRPTGAKTDAFSFHMNNLAYGKLNEAINELITFKQREETRDDTLRAYQRDFDSMLGNNAPRRGPFERMFDIRPAKSGDFVSVLAKVKHREMLDPNTYGVDPMLYVNFLRAAKKF